MKKILYSILALSVAPAFASDADSSTAADVSTAVSAEATPALPKLISTSFVNEFPNREIVRNMQQESMGLLSGLSSAFTAVHHDRDDDLRALKTHAEAHFHTNPETMALIDRLIEKGTNNQMYIMMVFKVAADHAEITPAVAKLFDNSGYAEERIVASNSSKIKDLTLESLNAFFQAVKTEKDKLFDSYGDISIPTQSDNLSNAYLSHNKAARDFIKNQVQKAVPAPTIEPIIGSAYASFSLFIRSMLDNIMPVCLHDDAKTRSGLGKYRAHGNRMNPLEWLLHDAVHADFIVVDTRAHLQNEAERLVQDALQQMSSISTKGEVLPFGRYNYKKLSQFYAERTVQLYQLRRELLLQLHDRIIAGYPEKYTKQQADGLMAAMFEIMHEVGLVTPVDGIYSSFEGYFSARLTAYEKYLRQENNIEGLKTSYFDGTHDYSDEQIIDYAVKTINDSSDNSVEDLKPSALMTREIESNESFISVRMIDMSGRRYAVALLTKRQIWNNVQDTLQMYNISRHILGDSVEKLTAPDLSKIAIGERDTVASEFLDNLFSRYADVMAKFKEMALAELSMPTEADGTSLLDKYRGRIAEYDRREDERFGLIAKHMKEKRATYLSKIEEASSDSEAGVAGDGSAH